MVLEQTYLLCDPHDAYAAEFIRVIEKRWGLRPVCLYTDPKMAFYMRPHFPILQSTSVLASYHVTPQSLERTLEHLKQRFDLLGVIPFIEQAVSESASILRFLEKRWIDPEILLLFRDKHVMKKRLLEGGVRAPQSVLVSDAHALESLRFAKFVLKPNDGFANCDVGIFAREELRVAQEHVQRTACSTWVAEEYVQGRELSINGQVNHDGELLVYSVLEVHRSEENHQTFYDWSHPLHSHCEDFATASAYAGEVLNLLGLRRSPFHMEIRLSPTGPALIDLGARLVGNESVQNIHRAHRDQFNAFELAAHDYLFADKQPYPDIDWSAYDGCSYVRVFGRSDEVGVITRLEGVEQVEAMPEFAGWLVKPQLGAPLKKTCDLFSMPYAVDLHADKPLPEMRQVVERVKRTLRWNGGSGSGRPRWLLKAGTQWERVGRRVRWELFQRGLGSRQFVLRHA